jgi:hypothetical protein
LLTYPDFAQVMRVSRLQALRRAFNDRRPEVGLADLWDGSPIDGQPRSLAIAEYDEVVIHLPEHRLSGWRWMNPDQLDARRHRVRTERPRPNADDINNDAAERPAADAPDIVEAPPMPSLPAPSQREIRPNDGVSGAPLDAHDLNVVEDNFEPAGFGDVAAMIRRPNAPRRLDAHQANLPIGGIGERTLVAKFDHPGRWHLQLHYSHAYDPAIDPLLTYELTVGVHATPLHAFQQRRLTDTDLDERLPGDPEDDAEFEVLG